MTAWTDGACPSPLMSIPWPGLRCASPVVRADAASPAIADGWSWSPVARRERQRDDIAGQEKAHTPLDRRTLGAWTEIRPEEDLRGIGADVLHRPGVAVIGEPERIDGGRAVALEEQSLLARPHQPPR